jgi:hypothetical protein
MFESDFQIVFKFDDDLIIEGVGAAFVDAVFTRDIKDCTLSTLSNTVDNLANSGIV